MFGCVLYFAEIVPLTCSFHCPSTGPEGPAALGSGMSQTIAQTNLNCVANARCTFAASIACGQKGGQREVADTAGQALGRKPPQTCATHRDFKEETNQLLSATSVIFSS